MPIGSPELNWVRQSSTKVKPKRYLAQNPRTVLFTAQITNFIIWESSIIGFEYENESGDSSDAFEHMTITIGAASGGYEKGECRFKSIDTMNSTIEIGEITYPEIECNIGDWINIIEEIRPFQVKPRIVPRKTEGSEYYDDFDEYHDFDIVYTNQNENIRPKANITSGPTKKHLVDAANFVIPGLDYRVITLSSETSLALAPGASIDTVTWWVNDCTIQGGDVNDTVISLRVPDDRVFRYISLTVVDTNGTPDTMYLPLWCFNDENKPLSNFQIRSEERDEGASMEIYFQEEAQNFEEINIAPGTLVYYWMDVNAAASGFIGRMMGWTLNEVTSLKKNRSDLSVSISNAYYWLNVFDGFGQEIRNTQHTDNETPSSWGEIYGLTVDLAAHYVLREYTTALLVCNFYPVGLNNLTPGEAIKTSTVWSQLVDLQKANEFATCDVNNMNYILCYRNYSYYEQDERDLIEPEMLVTTEDFTYDPGIQIQIDNTQRIGYVFGEGDSYGTHGTKLIKLFSSEAPGPASGYSSGKETTPYQRLPDTGEAQTVLNRLTGHHWKRVNNPYSKIDIEAVGILDFLQRGDVIEVEYLYDNIRGISWSNEIFIINKVSVTHSYERGQRPVVISCEIEKATKGFPGYSKSLDEDPDKISTPDKVLITQNGQRLLTENFNLQSTVGGPVWSMLDLELDGNVVQFQQLHDEFNSNEYCGVIVTTTSIYTIENIFDETPTVTLRHTFMDETELRSLDISKGVEWFGVVVSNYEDGIYKTYSEDLEEWEDETQIGSGSIYFDISDHGGEWLYNALVPITNQNDFDITNACGRWYGDLYNVPSGGTNRSWRKIKQFHHGDTYTLKYFKVTWTGNFQQDYGSGTIWVQLRTSHAGVLVADYFPSDSGFIEWTGSVSIPSGQYIDIYIQFVAYIYFLTDPPTPYSATLTEVLIEGSGDEPECPDEITYFEDIGLNQSPGVFTSAININKTYTSATYADNSPDGYEATDSSLTFERLNNTDNPPDINPIDSLCGDIHVPEVNNSDLETIVFHGAVIEDSRRLIFVEWTGLTTRDISPVYNEETFGPWQSRGQIESHPKDGWFVAVCVGANIDKSIVGVWVTFDNGATWNPVSSSISTISYYTRAFWYNRNTYHLYLIGLNGAIGWCVDADPNKIDDRSGNILELDLTGEIIGIAEKFLVSDE